MYIKIPLISQIIPKIGKVEDRLPMFCFNAPKTTGANAPTANPVMIIALEHDAGSLSWWTAYSTD